VGANCPVILATTQLTPWFVLIGRMFYDLGCRFSRTLDNQCLAAAWITTLAHYLQLMQMHRPVLSCTAYRQFLLSQWRHAVHLWSQEYYFFTHQVVFGPSVPRTPRGERIRPPPNTLRFSRPLRVIPCHGHSCLCYLPIPLPLNTFGVSMLIGFSFSSH